MKLRLGTVPIIALASAALAVMTAAECHLSPAAVRNDTLLLSSLLFGVVLWMWWALVAASLSWLGSRSPHLMSFSFSSLIFHIVAACLLAFAHLHLVQWLLEAECRYWPSWRAAYGDLNYISRDRFVLELLLYGCLFGISGLIAMQQRARGETVRALELEKQLSQAQLSALQMQLEPHFLFNTLNAVTTLVELGRNEEAAQMLAHMNTLLRTTLKHDAPEKIPLSQELDAITSYLAIQQVRFADRLRVKVHTTPEALEGMVPCFLLQPLIENAIRHGIAEMQSGGVIETSVERMGDTLRLRIRDNGLGANTPAGNGHGIGLRNTRERLAHFYPGSHHFDAKVRESGGFEVNISIPYERYNA